jgi:hypothetical protein
MKAHIRTLKLKKTEEGEDMITSLAVYSRKVEMSMKGGVYFGSGFKLNFGSLSGIVFISWQSPGYFG